MQKGITKSGELSPRLRVSPEVLKAAGNPKSDILGFFDYGQDRCGGTELTLRGPQWLGPEVMRLFQSVNTMYADLLPDEYQRQQQVVSRIPGSLVMPSTLYTTATLNQRLRTAAHRDSGDHPEATSALLATAADSDGGYVIADYGLCFNLQPGDVLFTDAHLVHGNLPFTGDRQTTVLYVREKMHLCPRSANSAK